jgi:hypothetical protein
MMMVARNETTYPYLGFGDFPPLRGGKSPFS